MYSCRVKVAVVKVFRTMISSRATLSRQTSLVNSIEVVHTCISSAKHNNRLAAMIYRNKAGLCSVALKRPEIDGTIVQSFSHMHNNISIRNIVSRVRVRFSCEHKLLAFCVGLPG